ncbi:cellulose binding domain-containing protein [Herbidospora cretacea]|uniref:cellulose binding domain-containing protein n=1 Tax=Herbidospora cretacea TaxID=28444 RepID=UPI000A85E769|nr:cellulose binding domain-containing protein [Herbidospora cretacea]
MKRNSLTALAVLVLVAGAALIVWRIVGRPAEAVHFHPSPSPVIAAAKCTADVKLITTWPGGFQGEAKITNTGTAPINDWYVQWNVPLEAKITQSWNGTWMQSGPSVMIHAEKWNKVLKPGATEVAGFKGDAKQVPTIADVYCG